jgi:hypothetical protein
VTLFWNCVMTGAAELGSSAVPASLYIRLFFFSILKKRKTNVIN